MLSSAPVDTPYLAYSYSYPHKTAYRKLVAPKQLARVWEDEQKDSLFLYMHIPFCEMRCGFCNLFTIANPGNSLDEQYLRTLERQAAIVSKDLGQFGVSRVAIGGGTPTFLNEENLSRLLEIAHKSFGVDFLQIPASIETSPQTATQGKLRILREAGIERISIGVQSFLDDEVRAVGRPQTCRTVITALQNIAELNFRRLNIDLIYGLPGQTVATLEYSLRQALEFKPEEIYLYPLYVRDLTGISRQNRPEEDLRLELYRAARSYLLTAGYEQISMRMFQLPAGQKTTGPAYCCQTDGMVGIGSGARSYTRSLHYSGGYAVSRQAIQGIITDYVNSDDTDFRTVNYGYELDASDRRRRYVIQSILQVEGLAPRSYSEQFASNIYDDIPELIDLLNEGLVEVTKDKIVPTERGLELSDSMGVRLYSQNVVQRMKSYSLT
jgi:oxygen-independent coproporphyrinogen III oxidase